MDTFCDRRSSVISLLISILCEQIFKFQEEYELSLDGFQQAKALDPVWEEPDQKREELLGYLARITELTKAKVN